LPPDLEKTMNATKAPIPKKTVPSEADATELPKPVPKVKAALPAKPVSKTANQKPAAAAVAVKPKTAKVGKPAKEDKPPKIKMVRDSYTMPENDYVQLADLKKRCLQAGLHVKKSELLRAGLAGLTKLADAALVKAIKQVEVIKTGRPAK
jgi:hypothetical protein